MDTKLRKNTSLKGFASVISAKSTKKAFDYAQSLKPFDVKITQISSKKSWYKTCLGDTVRVIDKYHGHYVVVCNNR